MPWDPERYERFAAPRARPFQDLVQRVRARRPRRVVDLGCGPGALTATLADRWPDAEVVGIDSSPEMIAVARDLTHGRPNLRFELGDVAGWMPGPRDDVVVTNAALQWIPDHLELLEPWLRALPPGAWFAMQVPGNSDAPTHRTIRTLASEEPWRPVVGGLAETDLVRGLDPRVYLGRAMRAGALADAWETTYLHVLTGEDAVLDWLRGTRLRPYLDALGDRAEGFERELGERLRVAYPSDGDTTVLPFRRVFLVARVPGDHD